MEFYQEEPGSNFTHDNRNYDLNQLLIFSDGLPTQQFDITKINWVLQWDSPDPERVATADLNSPILISIWNGKFIVLDGLHRLKKATDENLTFIAGKFIPSEVLPAFELQ